MLPLLMHYADVNTFMVQQVIKFTKDLPFFRCVPSHGFRKKTLHPHHHQKAEQNKNIALSKLSHHSTFPGTRSSVPSFQCHSRSGSPLAP